MDRFSDKYASLLKYTSDDMYTCRPTRMQASHVTRKQVASHSRLGETRGTY